MAAAVANSARVLIAEPLGLERVEFENLLREKGVTLSPLWWDQESSTAAADIHTLVIVRSAVGEDTLNRYPNLRMVAVAFAGYDKVDVKACRSRGIHVANAAGYSTDSVVELTLALALTVLRLGPPLNSVLQSSDWESSMWGAELRGKTVGIVGLGRIGRRVAEVFAFLGASILGCSRSDPPPGFGRLGVFLRQSDQGAWLRLFKDSDIVTLHLPSNPETRGIVQTRELSLMKPGACLINTARGDLIKEGDLLQALDQGHIRCALDVFATEPLPVDHRLRGMSGVVLTPHIGYRTVEALKRRALVTVTNIAEFLQGRLTNAVE